MQKNVEQSCRAEGVRANFTSSKTFHSAKFFFSRNRFTQIHPRPTHMIGNHFRFLGLFFPGQNPTRSFRGKRPPPTGTLLELFQNFIESAFKATTVTRFSNFPLLCPYVHNGRKSLAMWEKN
jgi:hypothetical protein